MVLVVGHLSALDSCRDSGLASAGTGLFKAEIMRAEVAQYIAVDVRRMRPEALVTIREWAAEREASAVLAEDYEIAAIWRELPTSGTVSMYVVSGEWIIDEETTLAENMYRDKN
jgi:hypothetical protein